MTAPTRRAEDQAIAAWDIASQQLDRFHITRVADVTDLDSLGAPTWIAVRPDSHTLSVSQGKGPTNATARISAVMESIEAWHCERVADLLPTRYGTASELQIEYRLNDLAGFRAAACHSSRAQWWVAGTGLVTGKATWVPLDYLDLSLSAQRRPMRAYTASTNGVAAGTDRDVVVLHALHEVIERHVVRGLVDLPTTRRAFLDLRTLPASLMLLAERLESAGCWVEVTVLPRTMGLATAVAYLYSESLPVLVAGSCSRIDLCEAVFGALTEAAQSRLGLVTGTREDAPSFRIGQQVPRPRTPPGHLMSYSEAAAGSPTVGTSATVSMRVVELARSVAGLTGHEPLVVDLSDPNTGIDVRRVVAPGLAFDMTHNLPRPQGETSEGAGS